MTAASTHSSDNIARERERELSGGGILETYATGCKVLGIYPQSSTPPGSVCVCVCVHVVVGGGGGGGGVQDLK